MSPETASLPEEEDERTWSDRAARLGAAARALLSTRLAIFREEVRGKTILFGRGLAAIAAAAALFVGALLLLAALLAALFAQLFHNTALGILVALLLYAGLAALAGRIGWKALSLVKPAEFPATQRELALDLAAIGAAISAQAPPEAGDDEEAGSARPEPDEGEVEDLEARLRGDTK